MLTSIIQTGLIFSTPTRECLCFNSTGFFLISASTCLPSSAEQFWLLLVNEELLTTVCCRRLYVWLSKQLGPPSSMLTLPLMLKSMLLFVNLLSLLLLMLLGQPQGSLVQLSGRLDALF